MTHLHLFGKKLILVLLTTLCVLASNMPMKAQTPSNEFGNCLVMKTTGEDRITLVRWISMSFVSHPAISSEIGISKSSYENADRKMAKLIVDLISVRCRAEAKAAKDKDSSGEIFKSAFEVLGRVSAQEIYGNENVTKRMSDFMQFVDTKSIDDALK